MLPSFLVLVLSILYLNHSCNTKSSPSISSEKNGLVVNSLGLSQNGEYEKDNNVCLTPGCVKAAASLINSMDKSVDPCDDFYQFACGNYIKNTIIKDDEIQETLFNEIARTTDNRLEMIITEPIQPDELRPFKMMKLLFKSCMDQEQIERVGLETFKDILKSLGGWPVLEADKWNESMFTWMESMYKIRDTKIFIKISVDYYNSTHPFPVVDSESLRLEQTYMDKGIDDKNVNIYYRYMVDIAVLFGVDRQRAIKEMGELLEFEIELAKIAMSSDKGNDKMKLADLQQKIPSIPLQDYLKKYYKIQQEDIIGVVSLKYLTGLETLLNKTPKRVQANYVIWRFVIDSVSFLTEELRDRKSKYEKEMNPRAVIKSHFKNRTQECLAISYAKFPSAMASMYVRRFLNENVKQILIEMLNAIMKEMYKIVSSIKWMDDDTRKTAIAKVKSMKNVTAYPDELFDDNILDAYYKNLEVNDEDFYTAVLNVTKFEEDFFMSEFWKPYNKLDWNHYVNLVLQTNAFYATQLNLIIIPAAILQGAIFSEDRPQYMIYGTIGTIISHEINHGFDSTGKMYDHNGNMVDWWEEETKKRFVGKEQCFIRQYDNYTVPDGSKLNGNKTLSENMADNGGWKLTYNAYREWVKGHGVEPRLPGLQEYTPQQLFWLSSANLWCNKQKENSDDIHSPQNVRIMGTFSNMEDFSNDFRCPLGSNMNPVTKCEMW